MIAPLPLPTNLAMLSDTDKAILALMFQFNYSKGSLISLGTTYEHIDRLLAVTENDYKLWLSFWFEPEVMEEDL